MSFRITGRVEVDLQKVKFLVGIHKEVKAEELKTPILVFDLPAVEDGVSNDEVGLLVVSIPELIRRRREGEEIVEHESGRSRAVLCCFEDGVVGEMDLRVELAERVGFMRESAICSMVLVDNRTGFVASD